MPHDLTTRVFSAVDSMQPHAVAALLADDATLVLGNSEPLVGREAVIAGLQAFAGTISGVRHKVINEWNVEGHAIVETEVTYRRLDGRYVSVPAVSIWQVGGDGLITAYRVFVDLTPVYY